jgi:hypothetical protein
MQVYNFIALQNSLFIWQVSTRKFDDIRTLFKFLLISSLLDIIVILYKFERFFETIYYMRILVFLSFTLLFVAQTRAQDKQSFFSRLKKQYFSPEKDSSRNGSFIVLPALGYAQETGVELGLASTYDFYIDKTDLRSRTSNITFMATITTKKQKNIKLNTDVWTKDNQYHILSELRYRDWPFNFYGIGNTTYGADEDYLGQQLIRAKLDVERKITPQVYIGLNAQFDHFKFDDRESGGIYESTSLRGKNGGRYLAVGTSLLWDSRDFTTYTTQGGFLRTRYAYAPDLWGGENFSGSLLEVDGRFFYSPYRTLTLATQVLYRGTLSKDTPFYMYRELGGDNTMRGYYLGRYRDNNYSTIQSEIRYRPISRLGAVVFGGLGSTFSEQRSFRTIGSYGLGLRYFFSLEHNSTVRFDYAIGEKRPGEKRQSGFYLSLSEAF